MTTPSAPQDPFAQPPAGSTPPPPGTEFGGTPAYTPPPPTYAPISVSSDNSLGKIGIWATVLTGLVALVTLGSALNAPAAVEATKQALTDPENADPFGNVDVFGILSFPLWIASYVVLALWMNRIRGAMTARGERVDGPPAVEWWGWFVPLAWYVLPVLGMRALTRGKAAAGILAGWWVAFCAYWTVAWLPFWIQMFNIDWTTGTVSDPDVFDALIPIAWISGIALLVAWAFLALLIRSTSAAERAVRH